jgi:hypothetical protein
MKAYVAVDDDDDLPRISLGGKSKIYGLNILNNQGCHFKYLKV